MQSVLACQCRVGRGGASTEHWGPQRSVRERRPSACHARQVWAHTALCHEPSAAHLTPVSPSHSSVPRDGPLQTREPG